MKKWILCICAVFFLANMGVSFPSWAQDKNIYYVEEEVQQKNIKKNKRRREECGYSRPIRVAGFVTNPPFGWVNVIPSTSPMKPDEYQNNGFAYDLFVKMAKRLGFRTVNVGFLSYAEAITALRQGKIDVLAGSYYDRRSLGVGTNLLFPSYFKNAVVVLFMKGKEKPISSFDDLKGLKGVVGQEEMLYSLFYAQLPKGVQIRQVAGAREAFRSLITGEADYMISSLYAAEAEIRRFKLVDDIAFSNTILLDPELFFVFSSHTDCRSLKPLFQKELEKEKKDERAYMSLLVEYIDKWGLRFKDQPSLFEQLQKEEDDDTVIIDQTQTAIDIKDNVSVVDQTQTITDTKDHASSTDQPQTIKNTKDNISAVDQTQKNK